VERRKPALGDAEIGGEAGQRWPRATSRHEAKAIRGLLFAYKEAEGACALHFNHRFIMAPKQSTLEISDFDFGPTESMSQIMHELAGQPRPSAPQPPPAPGSQVASHTQDTIADIEPATEVGGKLLFSRYNTIRELGRGGMGLVLLAHDMALDVPVALKLIPKAVLHDTDGIANLKKEVLRGRALAHPGIVRIHNFEQEGRIAVIVMEYVEGESLAQRKARQPDRCFDVTEVRPWLEQLAVALDHAHHEARIAHRDLKPGNLLITPEGRLKITDFGLASSLSESMSRISVRQGISGTPPYMSPQQLRGERPTHLDDIYSLGATIYELLTGLPPFFRGDVLTQVLMVEPPPMTERRDEFGVKSRPPIPPAWEEMVAACLSKDATQRPASAADMLRLLDGVPTARSQATLVPVEVPAVALQPIVRLQNAHRPASPTAATQQIQPRRVTRQVSLQPLVSATAALIRGLFALIETIVTAIIDVLKPVLKVAAVLVLLGGALFVKQRWDAAAAKRAAELAQSAPPAAAPATTTTGPSVSYPATYYPPPPPPPMAGGPSGAGPSAGPQGGGPPPGPGGGPPPGQGGARPGRR
jgi:serine/threonine protein kinase